MKSTITRFAIKNDNSYFSSKEGTWVDIWNATLWKTKPAWFGKGKIIMVHISYEESPYEVK